MRIAPWAGVVAAPLALLAVLLARPATDAKWEKQPAHFWLARLALEGRDVRLAEVQLATAALACRRGQKHDRAEKTLLRLL